jgi:DNA-binding CsgD family transcriptional regulator
MTAMIDDSRSRTHAPGPRPTRPIGGGAHGDVRDIFAGRPLTHPCRTAAPAPPPALPEAHGVWVAAALLLGAIARQTLTDPGAAGRAPRPCPAGAALTHGETRVLSYLPTNLSAREIAGELYVSVNTIKTHQRHLYQKLGAASRSQAVDRARALGLLAPSARLGPPDHSNLTMPYHPLRSQAGL